MAANGGGGAPAKLCRRRRQQLLEFAPQLSGEGPEIRSGCIHASLLDVENREATKALAWPRLQAAEAASLGNGSAYPWRQQAAAISGTAASQLHAVRLIAQEWVDHWALISSAG